jgi:predicted HTH domain antitoxin
MCKIVEDIVNERSREIAKKLITKGLMSYEEIAEVTGLPLEEVQKLAGSDIA